MEIHMKLSREQTKLLHSMTGRFSYCGPSSTGFSIRTFEALEKRGYIARLGNRSFKITADGEDIAKRLPKNA